MNARTTGRGGVRLEGNARERFYDSRGYGEPDGDSLVLAPVEAAHLLWREDLEHVDGLGLQAFLASEPGLTIRFLVYKNLRDRGFYLAPAERWFDHPPAGVDFAVFPRGQGPWGDEVEYRVRVVGERDNVPVSALGTATLAVVDEESEITYLGTDRREVTGSSRVDLPGEVPATLLGDRVAVPDAPDELYERGFYGQPLDRNDGTHDLQLSLVEAAHLAGDVLELGSERVVEMGHEVEGDRFDRRLRIYRDLRERGVVPKTGFKFGADFRTYADVETVEDLGHSELLVRVLPEEHVFEPRDLALDVRLAHGVRKTMVYAVVGEGVEFRSVERLTP
jgi:tRNA-intron endonuclease